MAIFYVYKYVSIRSWAVRINARLNTIEHTPLDAPIALIRVSGAVANPANGFLAWNLRLIRL